MTEKIRLGDFLLSKGIITEEELSRALSYKQQWKGKLGEVLRKLGIISEEELFNALRSHMKIDVVDLNEVKIEPQAINMITKNIAINYNVMPIKLEESAGKRIIVTAMSDPMDIDAIGEIQFVTGLSVKPVLTTERSLNSALNRYYGVETGQIPVSGDTMETGKDSEGDVIVHGGEQYSIGTGLDFKDEFTVVNEEDSVDNIDDIVREFTREKKLIRAMLKLLLQKGHFTVKELEEMLRGE